MSVLYFILLVGVLIFVHELGHFLVAKLFNIKVLKFSLGFGPRAFGFRRGETEYVLAWLPLGGFVRMLGEDPSEEISAADEGRAFHQKPLWQRYLVVFAGPGFNLIFPTVLSFAFYLAQDSLPPATIGKVIAGHPAAQADLQPGDKIVAIGGDRIRYFEDIQRVVSASPNKSLRFTIDRGGKTFQRDITPQTHTGRNALKLREVTGKIGVVHDFEPVQLGISDPTSPAHRAGLRTGDLVIAVNGRSVSHWQQFAAAVTEAAAGVLNVSYLRPSAPITRFSGRRALHLMKPSVATVQPEARDRNGRSEYYSGFHSAEYFVREVEPNSPAAKIGLRPGDRITTFNGKPLKHWETILIGLETQREQRHALGWIPYGGTPRSATFKQEKITFRDDYKQEQQRYVFGATNRMVRRAPQWVPIENRLGYAAWESLHTTGRMIATIALAVVQIFRGAIPHDTIGGPIMLFYTAEVAANKGWDHFLSMMALISINLALINLLPIPILDGGHIMFFTIEAVKRRPLSLRAREIASYVGLFLLMSLMIFAFKNDIVRYWFSS